MTRPGRRAPYTDAGIRRLPCVCCGAPARTQWNACADGPHRPLCMVCDVALNIIALGATRDPDARVKLRLYAHEHGVDMRAAAHRARDMALRAARIAEGLQ